MYFGTLGLVIAYLYFGTFGWVIAYQYSEMPDLEIEHPLFGDWGIACLYFEVLVVVIESDDNWT